jgi:hypothetical protein
MKISPVRAFFILLCSFGAIASDIQLDIPPIDKDLQVPYSFKLTPEGQALIRGSREFLYDLNPRTGELRNKIEIPNDFDNIASFGYIPAHGIYVVCAMKLRNQIPHWEVLIYDDFGDFVGNGYDYERRGDQDFFIYQIDVLNDRIFLNGMNQFTQDTNGSIQEVELLAEGDRFYFKRVGETFGKNYGQSEQFKDEFRHRWIAPSDDDYVFLVDQLQNRVFQYAPGKAMLNRDFSLNLENHRGPLDFYRSMKTKDATFEYNSKLVIDWLSSFSRVVGMYETSPGSRSYAIGYQSPNKKHKAFPKWGSPSEKDEAETTERTVLYLQLFQYSKDELRKIGKAREFPGAILIGVLDNQAFLFLKSGSNKPYIIRSVDLNK